MSISPKLRFEIFKKYDFTCQYCGRRTPEIILELDHVIPRAEGGTDDPENLIASCFECNRGEGGTPLDTILKDEDIHDKTVLLAEREMQLREYNNLKERIRARENEQINLLRAEFANSFSNIGYAADQFPSGFIRLAMKSYSYVDILDWIDYAVSRITRTPSADPKPMAAAKYLTGIIRNKLKEREERDGALPKD